MLLKFEPANCPNQLFWGKENMASEEALQIKHNPQVVTALKKLSEAAMQEVKFE